MINSIKYINSFSLIIFILLLPFSPALSNVLFAVFCISLVIELFLNKSFFESRNISSLIYVFLILLIYISINGLFQGSYNANKTLWKFLPILGIGSILIFINKGLPIEIIKKTSIISCISFVILCLIRTIVFYSQNQFIPFANEGEMVSILKIHRPYLGFYVLLNIILSFDLFIKTNQKKYTNIYGLISLFLFAFLVLISARLSIISFIIVTLIYILFYLNLTIIKKLTIGTLATVGLAFLVYSSPNIQERLNHNNIEMLIEHEPRFVLWESVNNIKNNTDFNSVIGYGNYQLIEDYLVLNYEQIIDKKGKRDYFIDERFNTHSQFFDYFLFGGYPAFFLFVSLCLLSLWKTKENFTSFAIVIAFILFFSVENVFHRQLGCYLFILYYILSLKNEKTFPED